jgi:hypothetical protein
MILNTYSKKDERFSDIRGDVHFNITFVSSNSLSLFVWFDFIFFTFKIILSETLLNATYKHIFKQKLKYLIHHILGE